jgi:hypothetical protein
MMPVILDGHEVRLGRDGMSHGRSAAKASVWRDERGDEPRRSTPRVKGP